MPELPEVETIAADLRPQLIGARFAGAHILWPRTLAEPDPETLNARLAGRQVTGIGRRGKYLMLHLDSGEALLIHLRMTGQLDVVTDGAPVLSGVHLRARFDLVDGRSLAFTDARKFGRIWLVADAETVVAKLGPEPLAWTFTSEVLAGRLRDRRVAIKALLLDQSVVAGVGNIYADEALFLAGIHPLRRARPACQTRRSGGCVKPSAWCCKSRSTNAERCCATIGPPTARTAHTRIICASTGRPANLALAAARRSCASA